MKKFTIKSFVKSNSRMLCVSIALGIALLGIAGYADAQNVGINTTGATPNPSALLDLNSGNTFTGSNGKGLLIPNVPLSSSTDKTTISNPAISLLVYVPLGSGLTPTGYYYNSGTVAFPTWTQIGSGSGGSYVKDSAWTLWGNTGTTYGTNYIGTNDDQGLMFKVDGVIAGRIEDNTNGGRWLTSLGWNALQGNTTGTQNSAIGRQSMQNNSTGIMNTAMGAASMFTNSTGQENTAFGVSGLGLNSGGSNNTAVGWYALNNTTAGNNTGVGSQALLTNTTGSNNTAIGFNADVSSGALSNATAIGNGAVAPVSNSVTLGNSAATALYLPGYPTVGDIFYTSAATGLVAGLAPGAAGQVLTSGGAGAAPTWAAAGGGGGWLLTGNAIASGNFLGTTNTQPLVFEVDGAQSGYLDYAAGTANSFYGYQAGLGNTGIFNTSIGYQSLASSSSGGFNTALGDDALFSNAGGANNTAVGENALKSNSSGTANTALGRQSMQSNTSGAQNTATGYQSLFSNVSGSNNTASGYDALYGNNTASYNTGVGFYSLFGNSALSGNTAMGDSSLYTQSYSTIPFNSGNVAIGNSALFANQPSATTNGNQNTAVGEWALRYNTSGNQNTAEGYTALYANTSGTLNVAIGSQALYNNQFGNYNVAVGWKALYATNSTGSTNIGIGALALQANTTGSLNIAIGYNALGTNSTSAFNIGIGGTALANNTAANNTGVGYQSLYSNSSGTNNSAFGYGSGGSVNFGTLYNTTGSNNTYLGYNTVPAAQYNNSTAIGANAEVGESNALVLGSINGVNTSAVNTLVGIGTTTPAQTLHVVQNGNLGSDFGAYNAAIQVESSGGTDAYIYLNGSTNVNHLSGIVQRGNTTAFYDGLDNSTNFRIGPVTAITSAALTTTKDGVAGVASGITVLQSNGFVGIGTNAPAQALQIKGTTNTARIDGLVSGGTFNVAPAAATSYLMYANTNGDVKAMPAGTNTQTLIWGATGPQWTTFADWLITGNTGTTPGTNYIGTNDDKALEFKTNSTFSGILDPINQNVYFGTTAGNNSGSANVAIGDQANVTNTTGTSNTAIGAQSMSGVTTGSHNLAVGYQAMNSQIYSITNTGSYNIGIGEQAMADITTGAHNLGIGEQALWDLDAGRDNVGVGDSALQNVTTATANNNTGVGVGAGFDVTTGTNNVAVGYRAQCNFANNNLIGGQNVAVGANAEAYLTNGSNNTAVGYEAMYGNGLVTGGNNTAMGYLALGGINTASNNTAIGYSSASNTTGANNTGVGYQALNTNIGGTNNTALGYQADVSGVALTNATAIGNGAVAVASNTITLGNTAVTKLYCEVTSITTISDGRFKNNIKENIHGLDFIMKLKPISYNLEINKLNAFKGLPLSDDQAGVASAEKVTHDGFIAQDVEKAAESVGYDFSGVTKPEGPKGTYGLGYTDFVVPLVKGMQEQQHTIDSLKAANEELKGTVADLQNTQSKMADKLADVNKAMSAKIDQMQSIQAKDQADIAELKKLIYLNSQTAEAKK